MADQRVGERSDSSTHPEGPRWQSIRRALLNINAILFAIIGTALYLLAASSYRIVMSPGTSMSLGDILACVIVCCLILYSVSLLTFRISDLESGSESEAFNKSAFVSTKRNAMVILLFWTPVLLIRFPGNYDPDTVWELLQLYGYFPLSNQHPWFDTLIFGGFWKMGDIVGSHSMALLLFCCIQVSLTALALGYAIHYFSPICPWWVLLISVVFLCGFPFIPMVAQSMMKDSLFAWLFILYVLIFIRILRTRGELLQDRRYLFFYFVVSLMCCLTKKTGLYIVLVDAVVCILYISPRMRARWIGASFCVLMVFSVGWESIALPIMGVNKGSGGEALSVPFQQVGLLLKTHQHDLKESDWKVLGDVFSSPEKISSDYFPLRSDAVKNHWNDSAAPNEKIRFIKWYLDQGVRHPLTYVRAIMVQDYPLIVPDTTYNNEDVESGLFYIDNKYNTNIASILSTWTEHATEEQIESKLDTACLGSIGQKISKCYDGLYLRVMKNAQIPFSKALYGFWIPFLAVMQSIRQRSKWKLLSLIPAVLSVFVLATGPVVLPRYMTVSMYLTPIELCILFANDNILDGPMVQ